MPYYLVTVHGDPARAAGLLALRGIQNVVHLEPGTPEVADVARQTLTARLTANDGESAVQRVREALEGEPFSVEDDAVPEPQ